MAGLGLVLAVLFAVDPAAAGKLQRDNEAVVRAYVDGVWNQHDLSAIDRHVSDPALRDKRLEMFGRDLQDYPDVAVELVEVSAIRDKVYAEWSLAATHAALGKPVVLEGVNVYRLAQGQIVEENIVYQDLAHVEQLGIDPFQPNRAANIATAQAIAERLYTNQEFSAFSELVAPDCTLSLNGGAPKPYTVDELKQEIEGYRSRLSLSHLLADGDTVSYVWTFSLEAPDGRSMQAQGSFTGRFEEGRVVEGWEWYDPAPFREFFSASTPEDPASLPASPP